MQKCIYEVVFLFISKNVSENEPSEYIIQYESKKYVSETGVRQYIDITSCFIFSSFFVITKDTC